MTQAMATVTAVECVSAPYARFIVDLDGATAINIYHRAGHNWVQNRAA